MNPNGNPLGSQNSLTNNVFVTFDQYIQNRRHLLQQQPRNELERAFVEQALAANENAFIRGQEIKTLQQQVIVGERARQVLAMQDVQQAIQLQDLLPRLNQRLLPSSGTSAQNDTTYYPTTPSIARIEEVSSSRGSQLRNSIPSSSGSAQRASNQYGYQNNMPPASDAGSSFQSPSVFTQGNYAPHGTLPPAAYSGTVPYTASSNQPSSSSSSYALASALGSRQSNGTVNTWEVPTVVNNTPPQTLVQTEQRRSGGVAAAAQLGSGLLKSSRPLSNGNVPAPSEPRKAPDQMRSAVPEAVDGVKPRDASHTKTRSSQVAPTPSVQGKEKAADPNFAARPISASHVSVSMAQEREIIGSDKSWMEKMHNRIAWVTTEFCLHAKVGDTLNYLADFLRIRSDAAGYVLEMQVPGTSWRPVDYPTALKAWFMMDHNMQEPKVTVNPHLRMVAHPSEVVVSNTLPVAQPQIPDRVLQPSQPAAAAQSNLSSQTLSSKAPSSAQRQKPGQAVPSSQFTIAHQPSRSSQPVSSAQTPAYYGKGLHEKWSAASQVPQPAPSKSFQPTTSSGPPGPSRAAITSQLSTSSQPPSSYPKPPLTSPPPSQTKNSQVQSTPPASPVRSIGRNLLRESPLNRQPSREDMKHLAGSILFNLGKSPKKRVFDLRLSESEALPAQDKAMDKENGAAIETGKESNKVDMGQEKTQESGAVSVEKEKEADQAKADADIAFAKLAQPTLDPSKRIDTALTFVKTASADAKPSQRTTAVRISSLELQSVEDNFRYYQPMHRPAIIGGFDPSHAAAGLHMAKPSDPVSNHLPDFPVNDSPETRPDTPLFLPSLSPTPSVGVSPARSRISITEDSTKTATMRPTQSSTALQSGSIVNRAYVLVPPAPQWVLDFKASHKAAARPEAFNKVLGKRKVDWDEQSEADSARGSSRVLDKEQQVALEMSFSRAREQACKWSGCDATMCSASNLVKHLEWHVQHDTDPEFSVCYWPQCGRHFLHRRELLVHVASHACSPIRCAYEDCDEYFRAGWQLVKHYGEVHKDGTLRPSVAPFKLQGTESPRSIPDKMPSYLTVDREIRPHPISTQRHDRLGPWVLRKMFAPVNLSKPYNAAKPFRLRSSVNVQDGYHHSDYDFLERAYRTSSCPSQPSDVQHLPDLDSDDVSNMINDGFVLWGPERPVIVKQEPNAKSSEDLFSQVAVDEIDLLPDPKVFRTPTKSPRKELPRAFIDLTDIN